MGDDASQWENGKFDPLPPPNPLTDRHKKLRTDMQNLVAIPIGVSFPRMREIAHQNVYSASFFSFFSVLPTSYSLDAWTDVHAQYVKRRGSAQGCAFSGLEDKHLTFTPVIPEKPPFLGPILTGQNFRPTTALQWGCSHVNSP